MSSDKSFDYRNLDETIHARPRLAIMRLLITFAEADFNTLKQSLSLTDGTLSIHLRKLEEAGFIRVKKAFVSRKPRSRYILTPRGQAAFERYLDQIEKLVKGLPL